MNNSDISIILPVYNGERYIENTLNSILSQSFDRFEIIAIDDGSRDRSRDILKKYAQKDSRVRVYEQENHGISATRNRGIQESSAPYIMFCDHDDEYLPGYIEQAYKIINESNADFVKFGCKEVYIDGARIVREHVESPHDQTYCGANVKEFLLEYQNDNEYIWDGIYTKEILELINGFDEKYKSGCEDLALILDLAEKAKFCICKPDIYYIHNIRNSFSTSRKYDENVYCDVMETWKRRFTILSPNYYPKYEQSKLRMLVWSMCGMFSFSNCELSVEQMSERFKHLYEQGFCLHGSKASSEKKKDIIYILYQLRQFKLLSKICFLKRKRIL